MDKNDLISRSELLERLKENRPLNWGDTDEEIQAVEDFNFFTSVVKNAPAVDPEELRPKGKWKKSIGISLFGHDSTPVFKCSKCGAEFCDVLNSLTLKYHYCPNCGAKMMED